MCFQTARSSIQHPYAASTDPATLRAFAPTVIARQMASGSIPAEARE